VWAKEVGPPHTGLSTGLSGIRVRGYARCRWSLPGEAGVRQDDRDTADWQEIRINLASLQQLTDTLSAELFYHLRPSMS
jgi:hypothetical protein